MHEDLEVARRALTQGGVIVYPTDTLYGLGCDATDAEAVQRALEIKGLPLGRGFSVLFPTVSAARAWGAWTPVAQALAAAFLPGALTLVLEPGPLAPEHVVSDGGTVGLRVVDRKETLALARVAPLVSTSANVHGHASARTIEQAREIFDDAVDAYVDVGLLDGPASTVVDARGDRPTVIREGALTEQEILEAATRG